MRVRGLAPLALSVRARVRARRHALAAPPKPLGLDCEIKGAVQFCKGNGASQRVASFDGVPLDVDVTLPSADKGNGPFPTIVMLHGYGGNKGDFEADTGEGEQGGSLRARLYHWNNIWFAERGYVVVNYTARGFGKSCGQQDARTPDASSGSSISVVVRMDPPRSPAEAHDTLTCSAFSSTASRSRTRSAPRGSPTVAARASSWPTCATASRSWATTPATSSRG